MANFSFKIEVFDEYELNGEWIHPRPLANSKSTTFSLKKLPNDLFQRLYEIAGRARDKEKLLLDYYKRYGLLGETMETGSPLKSTLKGRKVLIDADRFSWALSKANRFKHCIDLTSAIRSETTPSMRRLFTRQINSINFELSQKYEPPPDLSTPNKLRHLLAFLITSEIQNIPVENGLYEPCYYPRSTSQAIFFMMSNLEKEILFDKCELDDCRKTFVTLDGRRRFCNSRCSNTLRQRRYRIKT
jgi:hypothetical protein